MKTRFNSKTGTKLTTMMAVIAVMGSFAGCSATITAETSAAGEGTSAATTTTEAAAEVTTDETTAATTASESAVDNQNDSADDNGDVSYPELITSIDDNLFGIDIPVYFEEDPSLIDYMVNIREGDTIEYDSDFAALVPVGTSDADIVYIVYTAGLNPDAMNDYCDQFEEAGFVMDTQDDYTFAGNNEDGYRVVAQRIGNTTTVGVYDYANNPYSSVGGVG